VGQYFFKESFMAKELSSWAAAAKAIRLELKEGFPGIKFSVTSEAFSMGNAVRVNWTDGPTVKVVKNIIDKYQYGHFDGMTDMYEHSNSREDIPQTKFVTTSREFSDKIKARTGEFIKLTYTGCEDFDPNYYYKEWDAYGVELVYRELVNRGFDGEGVENYSCDSFGDNIPTLDESIDKWLAAPIPAAEETAPIVEEAPEISKGLPRRPNGLIDTASLTLETVALSPKAIAKMARHRATAEALKSMCKESLVTIQIDYLSDGSKVYNVKAMESTFPCVDYAAAEKLADTLLETTVDFTGIRG
jgi:hypothetical protein